MKTYFFRINKVIDYIEKNLDKPLMLDELANIAYFSKFHFIRIFQSITGETPFQFILRIRLEKAATALIQSNINKKISTIAYQYGFSDSSVFSRYFKNYYKISASQYRIKNRKISQPYSNITQEQYKTEIYFCYSHKSLKWNTNMRLNKSIEVIELPTMSVAYARNIGPYNGDQEMFQTLKNKLFIWAASRNLLMGKDFKFLVVYHDNPKTAIGENLRMSLCITIPHEIQVDGDIGKMEIQESKYAIARFELKGNEFEEAWNWLFTQWMPNSGYEPDDKPYFEMYCNAPHEGNYLVDFCIAIKPI